MLTPNGASLRACTARTSSRTASIAPVPGGDEPEPTRLVHGHRERRGRRAAGHRGLHDRLSKRAKVDDHKTTTMAAKIADVRATPVNIPLRAPYRFSYGSIAGADQDGRRGRDGGRRRRPRRGRGRRPGGGASWRCASGCSALDVRDLNEAERRCVLPMRYTPWGDVLGERRVFGGVEIALWDARGAQRGRAAARAARRRGAHARSA